MKKVLFATSALIATASVAAAETGVSFSGYGRFGLGYVEDRSENGGDAGSDDAILVSRFRLSIDGTVETDGGVEFFTRVRIQADENAANGEANEAGLNGALFSVIYGGLRVDAGNVGGAFDNLPGYYGFEPGLEEFLFQYSGVDYDILSYTSAGAGSNAVYFNYAVGDFQVGASYDQQDDGDRWDIGAAYTFNNITAALAYGQNDIDTIDDKDTLTVLTLGAEFGDFAGTVFVADDDTADEDTNGTAYGFSVAYNLGAATTIQAAYGDGSADDDLQNYGIGAIYDLGGGATLRGAVGRFSPGEGDSYTRADFGARFDF